MLTIKRLHEVLHYDPETGEFTWNEKGHGWKTKVGSLAGTRKQYVRIAVDKKRYLAHRLAWFYMTGEWPYPETDHRDRNSLNNKWSNLRVVTRSQNGRNRGIAKNNTSGLTGIRWNKHAKQWVVHVSRQYLGYRKTKDEAIALRAAFLASQ